MQKTRQRVPSPSLLTSRPQRRQAIAPPDIAHMDVLAVTPDEELIKQLRALEDERNRVLESHQDPRPWEEEVAYIRRELQVRRGRREAHDVYVRQLEREYAEAEANLPVADLDNTNFLRIIGELN